MLCERIYTNSRVIQKNDQGRPEFKFDYKCIYCGHCLAICPVQAITFKPLSQDDRNGQYFVAEPVQLDPAAMIPDAAAVYSLLGATRSNRIYLDRTVNRDKIEKVLDIMVRAPSAGNEQNRKYYILDDRAKLDDLEERLKAYYQKALMIYKNPILLRLVSLTSALNASKTNKKNKQTANPEASTAQQPSLKSLYQFYKDLFQNEIFKDNAQISYLHGAPVAIIITSDPKAGLMHQGFYKGDVTIAATYGTLMAKALGLATCWSGLMEMAVNKDRQLKKTLGINETERVDSAFVLGYSNLEWQQMPPRGPAKIVWNKK
jgi:nitroreductase/Pyruvate/2-oxoacid:ferredoxin oxidoreductase delta subunit